MKRTSMPGFRHIWKKFFELLHHSATNSAEFEKRNKSAEKLQANSHYLRTLHNEWAIHSKSTNLHEVASASSKNSSIILYGYYKLLDRFGLVLQEAAF